MHQVSRWKDPTLLLICFHTQLFTFTVSLITIEYTFVFNSWYLILFTNNCILNDAFPSKTGSLSSILGWFHFNYLLDDPVHLPVDFAPTQTSSIPRGGNKYFGTVVGESSFYLEKFSSNCRRLFFLFFYFFIHCLFCEDLVTV